MLVAADGISPANTRLWGIRPSERLDKDRFRADLEKVADGYQERARRLGEAGPANFKKPRTIL